MQELRLTLLPQATNTRTEEERKADATVVAPGRTRGSAKGGCGRRDKPRRRCNARDVSVAATRRHRLFVNHVKKERNGTAA